MAETIFGEYKYTTNTGMSGVIVTAVDKMKEYYSSFITFINISTVDYSVISMKNCFENCINLKSVISIPSSIIDMDRAFYNCKSLSGSIHVYNIPESYEDIFTGTQKNIYIIPHSETIKEAWEEIVSTYSNVKVEVEPIIDTYNNVVNTITIGGYDEEELENKIVSYLDLVCDDNVYIQENDELNLELKKLGWEYYVKDKDDSEYDYFYFEVVDRTKTAKVGFKKDTHYDNDNANAPIIPVDNSKFVNYSEPTFLYSYDKIIWNSYTLGDKISIGNGQESDIVYFKGDNLGEWYDTYTETAQYEDSTVHHYYRLWTHAIIEDNYVLCNGNIMSLRYGDDYRENYLTLPCKNTFKGLFYECTLLKAFYLLPAIYLYDNCYSQMFYGCSGLETVPALPATVLKAFCYSGMFEGCPITEAPELPATTLAMSCYGTGDLIKRHSTIVGGEYKVSCEGMFGNCKNLTVTPYLPATTLAMDCYGEMFRDCTSLTTPPPLSATTLSTSCYAGMFKGCTSLTTPPSLPATTLADYCYSGMFSGCTSLTVAPSLPATILEYGCYSFMFKDCTSLTKIPKLPATTLPNYCYYSMFYKSNIRANSTSASPCTKSYRIPTSGTGSTGSKSLDSMFMSKDGSSSFSPSVNTTFYINVASF